MFNTIIFDASKALAGYRLYKEGKYRDAIPLLHEILDTEPQNWYVRLLLAASFSKTGQEMAAERGFRYVMQNCPDAEIKQKACLALQAVNAVMNQKNIEIPPEFGQLADRILPRGGARIEAIVT